MDLRAMTVRALAVGATLSALSGPAFAFDDGYQNVLSSVLTTMGVLKPEQQPDIEYRERPPLVVPPKMELAKPNKRVVRPAAWPKDPDVIKARKANELARAPEDDRFANSVGGALSKDELAKGRVEAVDTGLSPGQCGGFGHSDATCRVSPDELRAEFERYSADNPTKSDEITAGVEPDRQFLTQPPKGYMKPTRTVKATAEAPEPKLDDANPKTELMYKAKPTDE